MLAFLTIIAHLMAMTYHIDKLQDGSALGFNTWLFEYILKKNNISPIDDLNILQNVDFG